MSGGMVTLIAQALDADGKNRSATLSISESAYRKDVDGHLSKLVRAWFTEDNPGIPARNVEVVVHRG